MSPVPSNQIVLQHLGSYKKTVVFDPQTSATFKALHEEELVQDAEPVQPKVFRPNRMVPAKVRIPTSFKIKQTFNNFFD